MPRHETVSPGRCKACDSLDGKNDFDRDLVRTKYDADGNIVSKEIVDRKHYSDASNVRDEIAKNVKKRNGNGVVDYQKEQFNRYLPDTPENRQKYVDDMAQRTGMSEAELQHGFRSTLSARLWVWNVKTNTITLKQTII